MRAKATAWRRHLDAWVHSREVQNLVMAVILVNSVTIGLETAVAHGTQAHRVLVVLDHAALVIFVVEIVIKLLAIGPVRFFSRGWNVFDFVVVAIALVPGAGPLSVLRTLRVLRLLRVIKFMPSLRRVVESLLMSLPGISAIGVLMAMIFYVSAVMATAMFGQAFPEWFGSMGRSLYTLFQVMTLESWSNGIVRPVMEHSPWAWLFFVPFILVSAFTMLNLFVAVIVDTMSSLTPAGPAAPGTAPANEGASIEQTQPRSPATPTTASAQAAPVTSASSTEDPSPDALLAEVRALREEIVSLRAALRPTP